MSKPSYFNMATLRAIWLLACIQTNYFGLRKLDRLLTKWGGDASPYLRDLWEERQVLMRNREDLRKQVGDIEAIRLQPEEEFQRWAFINAESDRLFPPRYVDIRPVFRFLYCNDKIRRSMPREKRIDLEIKMYHQVREIMKGMPK